eukprot:3035084-Rhodomonas_salina.1
MVERQGGREGEGEGVGGSSKWWRASTDLGRGAPGPVLTSVEWYQAQSSTDLGRVVPGRSARRRRGRAPSTRSPTSSATSSTGTLFGPTSPY